MNKDMYDEMDLPELVAMHKELGFYIQTKDSGFALEEGHVWPELQDPWGEFQLRLLTTAKRCQSNQDLMRGIRVYDVMLPFWDYRP
jgi:hypothetical protein